MTLGADRVWQVLGWLGAVLGPIVLTLLLLGTGSRQRDYVFLYLGLVAVVALLRGLWPGLVSAGLSFLLVDYFFVEPIGTLRIGSETDLVNLALFGATACIVGVLAERSRRLATSEQRVEVLQRLERERTELLGNVSHELRTPIATILTESTSLLASRGLEASSRRRIEGIVEEARRLNVLVSDALDMARIEGNALTVEPEPVQVSDAIESAAIRLMRISPTREVTWLRPEATVNVLADWARLGQIFDNLLTNADRLAPKDTPIEVRVANGATDQVKIRITDHGPGIPPELRDRLFERYVRAAGESPGANGGSGLGLAIVKGLAQAQHGSIQLERTGSDGTTFCLTLPRARNAEVTSR